MKQLTAKQLAKQLNVSNVIKGNDRYSREVNIYSITSPENYGKYTLSGNGFYLNDINPKSLRSGDKIVIAWEGEEIEIEIK